MLIGVHHIAISVPDIDKAVDFYCNILGFEVCSRGSWEKGFEDADKIMGLKDTVAKSAMLKHANTHVEFFQFIEPAGKEQDPDYPVNNHGITHFCLQVTDIEDEYKRLEDAGMRFHTPIRYMGGTAATYGRDPFGNVIEIYQIDNDSARLGDDAKPV